jgi:hypothetical protein
MGRTDQKKLCWAVVVRIGEHLVLHRKEYISLGDIADDLNLTYYQVANLSIGRSKQFDGSFKFQPKVEIKKIC